LRLGIEVDTVGGASAARQSSSEIDGSSGFAYSTFLIEDSDNAHTAWILAEIRGVYVE
jgi:hypothetical protein